MVDYASSNDHGHGHGKKKKNNLSVVGVADNHNYKAAMIHIIGNLAVEI